MTQVHIMRRVEVERVTGLPRSTIYDHVNKGTFPEPIQLTGSKAVGWLSNEINDWLQTRIEARDARRGRAA